MEAVSLYPTPYIIIRTSIRNERNHFRKQHSQNIKEKFFSIDTQFQTIQWDTKLLKDISGKHVERMAIIATGADVEQLLGVSDLPTAICVEMASVIYETLEDWNLIEKVQSFSFDTTSSNTDRIKGACALLKKKMERSILYLGCRHHIFEIILAAVFPKRKFVVSEPHIPIFKRFQESWSKINVLNIIPDVENHKI